MTTFFSADEIREQVKNKLERSSHTQKSFAEMIGISPQYLNDFLKGRREPGPAILIYFGYEHQPHFRKTRP